MKTVFNKHGVDYFLVGALARDIRLAAREEFAARRKTKDVDVAVLLVHEEQFYAIKDALLATGDFEESAYKAIKLIYKGFAEVDLLPFGEIENEYGELQFSRHPLLVMDMSGFKEVYPFVDTITVAEGLTLNVSTLEGLIILKLIANDDNPSRSKDITDIEHVLEVYFELNSNEIYTSHLQVMDLYSTDKIEYLQLVAARVLGRKINLMLPDYPDTKEKLKAILTKRPVNTWQAMLDGMNDNS